MIRTIHYIEQENGTYTEERRRDEHVVSLREGLDKELMDEILNTSSPIYRRHPSLRHLLEDDADYAEWLSQMGNNPDDTDPAIVAIRKIIRYKPLEWKK